MYFVSGAYWVLQMQEKHIPNKLKAAIIELTGDLPGGGEIFRAKKGEPNQYELQYYEDYNVSSMAEAASMELTVTRSGYYDAARSLRLLQNRTNGHLFLIGEELIQLISVEGLEETEGKPVGPLLQQAGERVFWINEIGAFCACLVVSHSEKMKAYLEALRVIEMEDWRE